MKIPFIAISILLVCLASAVFAEDEKGTILGDQFEVTVDDLFGQQKFLDAGYLYLQGKASGTAGETLKKPEENLKADVFVDFRRSKEIERDGRVVRIRRDEGFLSFYITWIDGDTFTLRVERGIGSPYAHDLKKGVIVLSDLDFKKDGEPMVISNVEFKRDANGGIEQFINVDDDLKELVVSGKDHAITIEIENMSERFVADGVDLYFDVETSPPPLAAPRSLRVVD